MREGARKAWQLLHCCRGCAAREATARAGRAEPARAHHAWPRHAPRLGHAPRRLAAAHRARDGRRGAVARRGRRRRAAAGGRSRGAGAHAAGLALGGRAAGHARHDQRAGRAATGARSSRSATSPRHTPAAECGRVTLSSSPSVLSHQCHDATHANGAGGGVESTVNVLQRLAAGARLPRVPAWSPRERRCRSPCTTSPGGRRRGRAVRHAQDPLAGGTPALLYTPDPAHPRAAGAILRGAPRAEPPAGVAPGPPTLYPTPCTPQARPAQDHLLEVLRPGLAERAFADGDFLLRQGETGTQLLYILEGTVDVLLRLAPARDAPAANAAASPKSEAGTDSGAGAAGAAAHDSGGGGGGGGGGGVPEVVGDELPLALLEVRAIGPWQPAADPPHCSVSNTFGIRAHMQAPACRWMHCIDMLHQSQPSAPAALPPGRRVCSRQPLTCTHRGGGTGAEACARARRARRARARRRRRSRAGRASSWWPCGARGSLSARWRRSRRPRSAARASWRPGRCARWWCRARRCARAWSACPR